MSLPAIKVEGLWKEYTVGAAQQSHGTFYDLLAHSIKAPFNRMRKLGGQAEEADKFWALRDVNFKVQPGEVLGVVGRNGAGKSTLLKILSRITAPTRGQITVRGRMASLLEVGTGFHPELSGRENIYLNATILGMGQHEISRKFDAIVDFSGVEKFLDTPVKRYSSGMYVRLAFAVAAYVEADILLIDEVLAVGDAEFQKRCLGMMGQVARAGRTVLFVSHNLTALRNLCTTGLLLDHGSVSEIGTIASVLERYYGQGSKNENEIFINSSTEFQDKTCLRRVCVKSLDNNKDGKLSGANGISIEIDINSAANEKIDVFVHCYNDQQVMVFVTGSFFYNDNLKEMTSSGMHRFTCEIPGFLLNDGDYSLDVMIVRNGQEVVSEDPSIISFRVQDDFPALEGWQWRPVGVIRPKLKWMRENI